MAQLTGSTVARLLVTNVRDYEANLTVFDHLTGAGQFVGTAQGAKPGSFTSQARTPKASSHERTRRLGIWATDCSFLG